MGGVIASRYSRLNAREQACDQINEMFGLNISVNYQENVADKDFEDVDDVDNEKKRDEY